MSEFTPEEYIKFLKHKADTCGADKKIQVQMHAMIELAFAAGQGKVGDLMELVEKRRLEREL